MPIGDRHSTSAPEGTPAALSAAGMLGLSGLRAGAPGGLLILGHAGREWPLRGD
jgi:hypothetical protein